MYHSIGEPEAGDRMGLRVRLEMLGLQLAWLIQKNWKIMTVGELLRSGASNQNEVAISFDDGYRDQLTAVRYLQEEGIKGTFFLITGKAGEFIGGEDYYKNWMLMEQAHWQELAEQGHEIGGHSHHHRGPLTLQSPQEITTEIRECRGVLQRLELRQKVGFSYPHGAYSFSIGQTVQACGFDYACGSRPGSLGGRPNRFYLPRIEISRRDSKESFIKKVEGRGELWRVLRHDLMRKVWRMQGRV